MQTRVKSLDREHLLKVFEGELISHRAFLVHGCNPCQAILRIFFREVSLTTMSINQFSRVFKGYLPDCMRCLSPSAQRASNNSFLCQRPIPLRLRTALQLLPTPRPVYCSMLTPPRSEWRGYWSLVTANRQLSTANRMSHSTLYSNLPLFSTHLPVIYGKDALFEPLLRAPILIFPDIGHLPLYPCLASLDR